MKIFVFNFYPQNLTKGLEKDLMKRHHPSIMNFICNLMKKENEKKLMGLKRIWILF